MGLNFYKSCCKIVYNYHKLLYRKWKNENLPQQSRKNVSKLFVNELTKICKLIADGSVEEIENYVYNEL